MGDRKAIRAIEAANRASAALRKQLLWGESESRKMINAIAKDTSCSAWLETSRERTARVRNETHDSLINFQQARQAQLSTIILQSLDEGMTISDIGRSFGVSRQLASRWAREARANGSTRR